jgi:hypothetical protein
VKVKCYFIIADIDGAALIVVGKHSDAETSSDLKNEADNNNMSCWIIVLVYTVVTATLVVSSIEIRFISKRQCAIPVKLQKAMLKTI